ncbi:PTS system cellobiose-specific IIB component [Scopulibacillus darangshiensis]|uniref:PTS system cellobiose-specific IIB component n=1 Tax=Scopulibacillus darangshiensis TaxID=442528 RepID=A0A4R2NI62_9BACL|nr:PTS sugar transporter subunit IIB [Scopulibacillus darangshiensis]TCP21179.1 PTS system cellobiose-specific IIB component [Scopulibacillus darangshiensis]
MNILLCCAAGMSTSMVVKKMQEAAQKQGKDYSIKAVDVETAKNELSNVDVLLIGPQVKYLLTPMQEAASVHHVPVAVINMVDYGMCNGEAVLKHAEELCQNN